MTQKTISFTRKPVDAAARPVAAPPDRPTDPITPANVHGIIGKHMLIDAFDFVVDIERSQGSYIYDAKTNKRYLDFFTFVASVPIGFNHPKMNTPEFK